MNTNLNIGDEIKDCYMYGIGELENIMHKGIIEATGIDWTIIRDVEINKPIFTNRSLDELSIFFKS